MIRQAGMNLVEVSIALLLTTIGALGFLTLMLQMQTSELETNQREQATRILYQVADSIKSNPYAEGCYALANQENGPFSYIGSGFSGSLSCQAYGNSQVQAIAKQDLQNWDAALKGANVTLSGTEVGAMKQARGCISFDNVQDVFTIDVVWQGESPTSLSTASCGDDLYFDPDGNIDNRYRRIISTKVRLADLS